MGDGEPAELESGARGEDLAFLFRGKTAQIAAIIHGAPRRICNLIRNNV